jgi:hypothetical protein
MEYAFWLYLLTRLDAFKDLFMNLSVVTGLGLVLTVVFSFIIVDTLGMNALKRILKWLGISFLCVELICALIPSKKDAMFIAGGIGVIEAARSDVAQRIASKSVGVIERFLDDMNAKTKETK